MNDNRFTNERKISAEKNHENIMKIILLIFLKYEIVMKTRDDTIKLECGTVGFWIAAIPARMNLAE